MQFLRCYYWMPVALGAAPSLDVAVSVYRCYLENISLRLGPDRPALKARGKRPGKSLLCSQALGRPLGTYAYRVSIQIYRHRTSTSLLFLSVPGSIIITKSSGSLLDLTTFFCLLNYFCWTEHCLCFHY